MSSELRVDKIIPTNGVPTGGGGGIIQVVQKRVSTNQTTNSTSIIDVTGLSAVITPHFTTSKIFSTLSCYMSSTSNGYYSFLYIYQGSSQLAKMVVAANGAAGAGGGYTGHVCYIEGFHSPATTSATTYKARFKAENNAQSTRIGAGANGGTADIQESILTLYEVSA